MPLYLMDSPTERNSLLNELRLLQERYQALERQHEGLLTAHTANTLRDSVLIKRLKSDLDIEEMRSKTLHTSISDILDNMTGDATLLKFFPWWKLRKIREVLEKKP